MKFDVISKSMQSPSLFLTMLQIFTSGYHRHAQYLPVSVPMQEKHSMYTYAVLYQQQLL